MKQFRLSTLLVVAMLTYPSLLITYLLSLINFNLSIFRILLLFVLIIIAMTLKKEKLYFTFSNKIFEKYFLGIAILIMGLAINSFGSGTVNLLRTVILFPLFLIIMKSKDFDLKYFINFYLNIAAIIALLSIIQYIATPLGLVAFRSVSFGPVGGMIGFGGFGGFAGSGDLSIPRNVGFFTEPTNFAQMLMIPLALSAYKLFTYRKVKYLMIFIIIATAFILTFSVANFFGLFVGLIIYQIAKLNNYHFTKHGNSRNKIISLSLLFVILYVGNLFYLETNNNSYNSEVVIGKNTNASTLDRVDRIDTVYKNILENPFGNWSFREKYSKNAGFIGNVLNGGGFPFLIFWIFFLYYFYKKMYKVASQSQYLLIYIGIFALFLPMLWDVQFMEAQFLFYLAFFTVVIQYDQQRFQFI